MASRLAEAMDRKLFHEHEGVSQDSALAAIDAALAPVREAVESAKGAMGCALCSDHVECDSHGDVRAKLAAAAELLRVK